MYYFIGFYCTLVYTDFATDITVVQMYIASLIVWYLNMLSITWFKILHDDDDVNPEIVGEIEATLLYLTFT